jgi:hypothetical protein
MDTTLLPDTTAIAAPEPLMRTRQEPGGFWIPNELVDAFLRILGPRGVYLYCVLARAVTRRHYPSFDDLCQLANSPRHTTWRLLSLLRYHGLLNDSDIDALKMRDEQPVDSSVESLGNTEP